MHAECMPPWSSTDTRRPCRDPLPTAESCTPKNLAGEPADTKDASSLRPLSRCRCHRRKGSSQPDGEPKPKQEASISSLLGSPGKAGRGSAIDGTWNDWYGTRVQYEGCRGIPSRMTKSYPMISKCQEARGSPALGFASHKPV